MVTNKCRGGGLAHRGKQCLPRFALVSVLLSFVSACGELPYNNLDNAQLQTLLQQHVPIYDIRRAEEWRQTGIIESSELLTFVDATGRVRPDFLQRFTTAVGKHDPVILICLTGSRTRALARQLTEQMGYTQVYNVRNGISQWIREGRAVARP